MKLYFVEFTFISTFMFILYFCVTYVLCVLCMSSWVSIKMSHVYLKGLLIQIKFVAFSSQIFFQSFFVESKFLIFCIVTQIGASFDHFPYFSYLTEYRVRFVLFQMKENMHPMPGGFFFIQSSFQHTVLWVGPPCAFVFSLNCPPFKFVLLLYLSSL